MIAIKIIVQNESDKNIMADVLYDIGFDIFNKVIIEVGEIEYRSVYQYITEVILLLSENEMLNQKLYLLTPLSPSNNHYLQQARWGGKFTPEKTKIFQNNMKKRLMLHKDDWVIPSDGKYINTVFSFWFSADNRDGNNYFKVPLDVCESYLYIDDKRTLATTKDTFISDSSLQLMEISPSSKIGVFSNLTELQMFIKSNCKQCRRNTYKRRCTDFYRLLENRLPEGNDNVFSCLHKTDK